jgi:phosphatidate phosphatase APP1
MPLNRTSLVKLLGLLLAGSLVTGCGTPQPATDAPPEPARPAPQTPGPVTGQTSAPQQEPVATDHVPAPAQPAPESSTTAPRPETQTMPAQAPNTNLKTDEQVLMFPTNAVFDENKNSWLINVHGWVFEPERDSIWRNGLIKSLALSLGVKEDTIEERRFEDRTAMFLVDNEGNKNIVLKANQQYFRAPTTGSNGHFEFDARLSHGKNACNGWLTLQVHTNGGDRRSMRGKVQCLSHQGVSVISDIDDTIKDSNVLDKKELLKKTFLKEFSAVKGMSDVYQHWQQLGYQFHYVSSSPWQLYPVLSDFIDNHAFPEGSMHLKLFRLKDESFFNIMATPEEGKIPTITTLLETYPERQFILVGDSGEKDPDIYATIARKYPGRIIKIYIHNVTGDKPRIETIFKGLPKRQWTVFENANEILSKQALLNPAR